MAIAAHKYDDAQQRAKPEDLAMSRYASGDDRAIDTVYEAISWRLYAFFVRRCRESALAEDLLQHTFLNIHRARTSFVPGSPVLPWAFAIARRLLLSTVRRAQRAHEFVVYRNDDETHEYTDRKSDVEHITEARELSRRMFARLDRLPENQRTAFELLRLEGLSLVEAAAELGITVSALKLRAHRAYRALDDERIAC